MRVVRTFVFVQLIDDGTDGGVCMTAHDFEVVEDGAPALHRLPCAVFKHLKADAEVESVLHKGFACSIVAAFLPVCYASFLRYAFDVTGDNVLEGVISSLGAKVEMTRLGVHIVGYDGLRLVRDGEGHGAI